MLYRIFPYAPASDPLDEGGALFVPRLLQGGGRHDNPEHYGALYTGRAPESAVAEYLQAFRGRVVEDAHLVTRAGRRYALGAIDDDGLEDTIDLDDPAQLIGRGLRPSMVATNSRSRTQRIAMSIFEEGAAGLGWWSTLEASWANVTLFAERAIPSLTAAGDPEPLAIDHPVLRVAADALGIRLA